MADITIIDYSDKAIAVAMERDCVFDWEFNELGGRFNSRLKFGPGWIFSRKKCAERLRGMLTAYGITFASVALSDIVTSDGASDKKDTSDKKGLNILSNPDKQKHGLNVNDMAMMLPGGEIIVIGRESIKTEFCFGYSSCGQGPTSEEARAACDYARNDERYFMAENLARLDCIIDKLTNPDKGERRHLWIANWYRDGINKWNPEFSDTPTDKPEWLDPRERSLYDNGKMRPATDEEQTMLIEFYKLAHQAQEKRCRTYLKRYGLTKLRCWTYWMDA